MNCDVCKHENPAGAKFCSSCGSALGGANKVATHLLPLGTKLRDGSYCTGKMLGQGGFGITYKGADLSLGRPVAIKEFFPQGVVRHNKTVCLGPRLSAVEYNNIKAGFLAEARTLAHFSHASIARVFNVFEENNTAYIVMEFLEGDTLERRILDKKRLSECEALTIAEKVGAALMVVHSASLIHRDIKPDNIMLTLDGRIVLIDFGTARAFAAAQTVKHTAMLTPGYAPLEQYGSHARFGAFTDVYALGATLYHCLTGELPPPSTDIVQGVELREPHRLNPAISQNVSRAVMRAMQIKASERFQSISVFLDALKQRVAPVPIKPTPPTPRIFPNSDGKAETTISTKRGRDGTMMVWVPEGYFTRGSDTGSGDEKPVRQIWLDGFWMDETQVTVAQYRTFCEVTGRAMPKAPRWKWRDNFPMVNVTWHDAMDYATWAGRQLPSEAQWEKAARGTDGRVYPWGNKQDKSRTTFDVRQPATVGSRPSGASPYGCLDMAGNVWEWCADYFRVDYYGTAPSHNPLNTGISQARVLRGASWSSSNWSFLRASYRRCSVPSVMSDGIGFRCASPGR